jgi:hypothetical protein
MKSFGRLIIDYYMYTTDYQLILSVLIFLTAMVKLINCSEVPSRS